jgi:hypothetical protein
MNPNGNPEQQSITLSQAEFRALMTQMQTLTKQVQDLTNNTAANLADGETVRSRPVRNRTVTLAVVEGMPVVGLANAGSDVNPVYIREVPNPRDPKQNVLIADLIVLDVATKKTSVLKNTPYLEFVRNAERKVVPVIRSQEHVWENVDGTVTRKEVDYDKYRMVDTGEEVDAVVEGVTRTFYVDYNGTEIEVDEKYVNIVR